MNLALKVKNGYIVIGNIYGNDIDAVGYNTPTRGMDKVLQGYTGCTVISEPGTLRLDFCEHIIRISTQSNNHTGTVNVDDKYFGEITTTQPFFFKL